MYSFLIVDDEHMICKSMCLMLERSGLPVSEIKEAGDGKEALDCLNEKAFDFVITDIRMPKMDGLELCCEINKRWPETAILIVSGYDDFKYAQQAMKYGVKEYILKPVNGKKLVSALSIIIENLKNHEPVFHLSLNELEPVISRIETALWNDSGQELAEECSRLLKLLNKAAADYFKAILDEVLQAVIKKLSDRIGYVLNIKIGNLNGNRRESCYEWFRGALNTIGVELKERKANVYYNMVDVAKKYIEEHYNENVSLDDLGSKLNLSPGYFSQFFKQQTGKTFIEYRTHIRMRKAGELLCQPEKTVTEVTFDVGYQSATHFIRTFKKYCGLSPSEFRHKSGVGK